MLGFVIGLIPGLLIAILIVLHKIYKNMPHTKGIDLTTTDSSQDKGDLESLINLWNDYTDETLQPITINNFVKWLKD